MATRHDEALATYDQLKEVEARESLQDFGLSTTASQGDGDSIKKTHSALMEAAGIQKGSDRDRLKKDAGIR